ncbi:MAG: hypothetical protein mread185_000111 [Mycoplasmataceae bacterium]|nr:MAG: hypothetical protein mread185_000111 [Mycoplasmataceae bacterium]
MNQTDNKLLSSLLKRLQELDQENKNLKEKLTKQAESITNKNPPHSKTYLKIKELILANLEEQQICSLCNCVLDESSVINLIKLYFCNNNNCSLLMEKSIETVLEVLRKQKN